MPFCKMKSVQIICMRHMNTSQQTKTINIIFTLHTLAAHHVCRCTYNDKFKTFSTFADIKLIYLRMLNKFKHTRAREL